MKTLALIAATGSLAAFAAPAQATETPHAPISSVIAPAAMAAQFDMEYGVKGAAYDRDRRYRDRRYRDGRYDDDDYRDRRHRDRSYDRDGRYHEPRRIGHRDRVWRGRDGRYYCERDNGTTGLVIGAGVGALLGRTIDTRGDRTVGTLLGGALGAVLGREVDRSKLRCR